jgi:hypothetical protein
MPKESGYKFRRAESNTIETFPHCIYVTNSPKKREKRRIYDWLFASSAVRLFVLFSGIFNRIWNMCGTWAYPDSSMHSVSNNQIYIVDSLLGLSQGA